MQRLPWLFGKFLFARLAFGIIFLTGIISVVTLNISTRVIPLLHRFLRPQIACIPSRQLLLAMACLSIATAIHSQRSSKPP